MLALMVPTLALANYGPEDYIPYPGWILFGIALISDSAVRLGKTDKKDLGYFRAS